MKPKPQARSGKKMVAADGEPHTVTVQNATDNTSSRQERRRSSSQQALTASLGLGLTLCAVGYRLASPQPEHLLWVLAVGLVATTLYLVAFVACLRGRAPSLGTVVLWAVLMRLPSLGHEPTLTTDFYRYLWDGKVQAAGINPYLLPPDDPALRDLRDDSWRRINHKWVPTLYPPTSQLCFRLVHRAGGLPALRLLFLGLEVWTWVSLTVLLRRRGLPRGNLALFAWCPGVIHEVAFNLHQDILGIALLAAAVASEGLAAGFLAGLSTMAKGYSLLALPVLCRRHGRHVLLGAFIAVVVVLLPYVEAGEALFSGLGAYADAWRGHGTLFPLLTRLFSPLGESAEKWALLAAGACVVAVSLTAAAVTRHRRHTPVACGIILSTLVLFSPVVYPWYLLWVAAFLPFTRSLPWGVLSCSTMAAYLWFKDHTPVPWTPWVEYTPFVLAYLAVVILGPRPYNRAKTPSPFDSPAAEVHQSCEDPI